VIVVTQTGDCHSGHTAHPPLKTLKAGAISIFIKFLGILTF